MIKRRQVLLGSLGAVAAAGLGLWGGEVLTESVIAAAVRRRLEGMLKLDEAGVHAYARDQMAAWAAKRPTWAHIKYHLYSWFTSRPGGWGISNDHRSKRERFEESLATTYLLSTDFFWTGADPARVVRYLQLYTPMRACGNPFARRPSAV